MVEINRVNFDYAKDISSLQAAELLRKKSKEELINIILDRSDIQIPVSIFVNEPGPLECLVQYLHREKGLNVKDISLRLNRNVQTIWTTYRNSKKKRFSFDSNTISVPLRIFAKEDKSILESLIAYLHSSENLRFCDISRLLGRDNRTVWLHYHRYKAKQDDNSKGGKKNEN